ncbi:hypothetical protein SLEP1_g43517 [Rubroshorea leprosula]|uniref:Uncharacterized protein n=1 Tax=Rubroshorea leprosula TaxID=152421 RepID=A0AAV5LD81_9ROSI|nr:hypothetical protein SLEP1_g43517 [Rubroshorea leprosula]
MEMVSGKNVELYELCSFGFFLDYESFNSTKRKTQVGNSVI